VRLGGDAFFLLTSSSLQLSHASALLPPTTPQKASDTCRRNTYDGPRRSETIGRMADHSSYLQEPHNNPPAPASSSVPGSLLPGGIGQGRPAPLPSAYTAPTAVPQINTNASHYSLPTRSNTMHSHSHSRSSPAGLDQQKYVPNSIAT
jgi:WD repeat-containing protein 68